MIRQILQWLGKGTRDRQQTLANGAMVWLKDETLNAAIAKIRMNYIDRWYAAQDPEVRERAWLGLHSVDEVTHELRKLVEQEEANVLDDQRKERQEIPLR